MITARIVNQQSALLIIEHAPHLNAVIDRWCWNVIAHLYRYCSKKKFT